MVTSEHYRLGMNKFNLKSNFGMYFKESLSSEVIILINFTHVFENQTGDYHQSIVTARTSKSNNVKEAKLNIK